MTNSTVWISYDLGIRGDYEGLYAWLDSHRAKECGDSLAVLQFDHDGALLERLREDLEKSVRLDKRSRVYVIFREAATNKNKGVFIVGGRKAPVWTGYSPSDASVIDEEA